MEFVNEPQTLTRNGFVTFWLWMCAIVNILATVAWLAMIFTSDNMLSFNPGPMWMRAVSLVCSIVGVTAYFMLLTWNKKGFMMLCGVACLNLLINLLVYHNPVFAVVTSLLGIVILFLILQIRSNGVSYWKAMDMCE